MNQLKHCQSLIKTALNKEKWWEILSRFIDVLRINIFMVDTDGRLILPPEEGKFGGRLLMDPNFKADFGFSSGNILTHLLKTNNHYLEAKNEFNLHIFAIPMKLPEQGIIAHIVVGPVILHKRVDSAKIRKAAKQLDVDEGALLVEISELRVLSNLMMIAILDLLLEVSKDSLEMEIKAHQHQEEGAWKQPVLPKDFERVAEEIYSTVRFDELLVALLDLALKMTGAENGSIMIVDKKDKRLNIKVSKGLDTKIIKKASTKLGEGIAGIAAKENSHFIINGGRSNSRIGHLLKRPDIKQSLVMPLSNNAKVLGVLNINSKNQHCKIEESLDNLQHLSKLISSVL